MNIDINNLPESITMGLTPTLTNYGYIHFMDTENIQYLPEGYIVIGDSVEVTFKTTSRESIVNGMVSALKKEAQTVRAEAESKCRRIDEKIQSLLALPAPKTEESE